MVALVVSFSRVCSKLANELLSYPHYPIIHVCTYSIFQNSTNNGSSAGNGPENMELNIDYLLTKCEVCIGKYFPEVFAKKNEGKYFPV